MNKKAVLGSTLAVGLMGLGIYMGSTLGAQHASAQAVVPARVSSQVQGGPSTQAKVVTQAKEATSRSAVLAQIAAATAVPTSQPSKVTITKAQAEAAALAASPGNTIDHTSLGDQNGVSIYDVDFANGGGVIINAETGAVISTEAAGADKGGGGKGHGGRGGHFGGGQDQAALAAKATVTKAQAEAAALAASPGNTIDHSRLGDNNGTVFWDIDFANGGGVTIDAQTGKVIATEAAGTDKGGPKRGPAQTQP